MFGGKTKDKMMKILREREETEKYRSLPLIWKEVTCTICVLSSLVRFNKVPSGEGGLRPTNKKLLPLSSINNFIKYKKSNLYISGFGTIKSITLKKKKFYIETLQQQRNIESVHIWMQSIGSKGRECEVTEFLFNKASPLLFLFDFFAKVAF